MRPAVSTIISPLPPLSDSTTHHTTMSWKWSAAAGFTRGTTLAAEEEAAATGTQLDNASLIDILMGRMTVDVDPTPTAAEWPDEEHVALARRVIEHPFLVVPQPKNADHSLCVVCGIFSANTLVVPDPGTVQEWPACKGMFPTRIVDRAQWTMPKKITFLMWHPVDAEFRVALGTSVNCNACYKEKNTLKDCNREGCVRKRNCLYVYYKSCRNLNNRRTSTCFLCEGDITRASAILQKQKKRIKYVTKKIIWIASVDARHTRAESAERRGGIMVGAKAIASWGKIPRK